MFGLNYWEQTCRNIWSLSFILHLCLVSLTPYLQQHFVCLGYVLHSAIYSFLLPIATVVVLIDHNMSSVFLTYIIFDNYRLLPLVVSMLHRIMGILSFLHEGPKCNTNCLNFPLLNVGISFLRCPMTSCLSVIISNRHSILKGTHPY